MLQEGSDFMCLADISVLTNKIQGNSVLSQTSLLNPEPFPRPSVPLFFSFRPVCAETALPFYFLTTILLNLSSLFILK